MLFSKYLTATVLFELKWRGIKLCFHESLTIWKFLNLNVFAGRRASGGAPSPSIPVQLLQLLANLSRSGRCLYVHLRTIHGGRPRSGSGRLCCCVHCFRPPPTAENLLNLRFTLYSCKASIFLEAKYRLFSVAQTNLPRQYPSFNLFQK